MTALETTEFIDCVTHEDCTVRLHGKVYWCCGLSCNKAIPEFRLYVYECDTNSHEWIRDVFQWKDSTREACMRHFLEDQYWDGKSFYEVAPDMEWIDL